jgi:hypothetical protein
MDDDDDDALEPLDRVRSSNVNGLCSPSEV